MTERPEALPLCRWPEKGLTLRKKDLTAPKNSLKMEFPVRTFTTKIALGIAMHFSIVCAGSLQRMPAGWIDPSMFVLEEDNPDFPHLYISSGPIMVYISCIGPDWIQRQSVHETGTEAGNQHLE